ncbi:hypothetical protein KP509_11G045000 [Ceratopteris richardii]|nr:hypothetical protein KP509_11G045000 [Ceratopteris richardii]
MVFHFDTIIEGTFQEATFNSCARDIVEDVLCGYNGTVMAYGQSGSGKTFTMSGDPKNSLHQGIIPRSIQRIFADKMARPESETSIHVSYLEVYNEVIYDLLTDRKEPLRSVSIMEENGQIEMKGLCQIPCETEEEALKHFLHGERRRCTGPNTFHKFSNRSHCMFTIYVERHSKGRGHPDRTAAKLNLVDLAGCERFKCIDPTRQSEKEVLNINKSLTFLEQAVSELRKGQGHVSFRQSRLTMLLRDALGGNSKTALIVCALPEDDYLDETISALRFSQRVKDLKTSAVLNRVVDSIQAERQLYERKIAELKRELAFYDALNGRPGISREDLTEQKKVELKGKVEAFLSQKEGVEAIPIESLMQIKETYNIFKEAQAVLHAKLEKLSKENSISKLEENQNLSMIEDDDGVGELEPQGFALGVAPLDWRPEKSDCDTEITGKASVNGLLEQALLDNENSYKGESEQRNLAFHEFKRTVSEGIQQCYMINAKKSELREKKLLMQHLAVRLNDYKQEIHEINVVMTEKARNVASFDQEECETQVDDDYIQLEKRLEKAKLDYQKCYGELAQLKGQVISIREEMLKCQENLLNSFFEWYKKEKEKRPESNHFLYSKEKGNEQN